MYFVCTTLGHEYFSNTFVVPFKNYVGIEAAEYWFVGLSLALIVLLLLLVRKSIPFTRSTAFRGFILLACLNMATQWLMVTKVEMVHYPQYALLAFFLRMGGLSAGATFLTGQCASIVDEGRQYLFHPRFTGYFDWNDILINSIGLALGLWITQGRPSLPTISCKVRLFAISVLISASIVLFLGLASGYIVTNVQLAQGQSPTAFPHTETGQVFALSLKPEESPFWHQGPFGLFHIMNTLEGILLVPLLSLFVFFIGAVGNTTKLRMKR